MKIRDIRDPLVFIALKHVSRYVVDTLWRADIYGDEETEYEHRLAVLRSKRIEEDIKALTAIDLDLGWGQIKEVEDEENWIIRTTGDFNPWYSGERTLGEFITAVDHLYEFLSGSKPRTDEVEFLHYFDLLRRYNVPTDLDFWPLIHPVVRNVAWRRFYSGQYADSVLASCTELEDTVRTLVKERTGEELSGSPLMQKAFSPRNPVIVLDNLANQSGKDRQRGYMELFSGAMLGIRNPKAHRNLTITRENAIHLLFLTSSLLYALEDAIAHEEASDETIASGGQD